MQGVGPGTVVGGRYSLSRRIEQRDGAERWFAHDTTLYRDVTVLLVPGTHPQAAALLDAARRSAGVDNGHLVRVLDAGLGDDHVFVVEEDLSAAQTLSSLAARGGLPAEEVRRIVGITARALEGARLRGLHHEAITPDSVVRTSDGTVKVLGLATAAALLGREGSDADGASRTDAVAVVALAYAGLTGRWPLASDSGGLPPAPRFVGGVAAPSEIAAGVPHDLDTLCRLTLNQDHGPTTPGDFARQIAPWSHEPVSDFGGTAGLDGADADTAPRPVLAGPDPTVASDRGTGRPSRAPADSDDLATPRTSGVAGVAAAGATLAGIGSEGAGVGSAAATPSGSARTGSAAAAASSVGTSVGSGAVGAPGVAGAGVGGAGVGGASSRAEMPGAARPAAVAAPTPVAGFSPGASAAAASVTGPDVSAGASPADPAGTRQVAAYEPGGTNGSGPSVGGFPVHPEDVPPAGPGAGAAVVAAIGTASAAIGSASAAAGQAAGQAVTTVSERVGGMARNAAHRARERADERKAVKVAAAEWTQEHRVQLTDTLEAEPQQAERPAEDPVLPLLPPDTLEPLSRDESKLALGIISTLLVLALVVGIWGVSKMGAGINLGLTGDGRPSTLVTTERPTGGAATSGRPTTSAPPQKLDELAILSARAFDPLGDDKENDDAVGRVYDGKTSTVWTSEGYDTADLGGIKSGVGVILDIGANARARQIIVNQTTGSTYTVYLARDRSLDSATKVGTSSKDGSTTLTVPSSAQGQYVIVWFTKLTSGDGGRYRASLAEVTVLG